MSRIDITNEQLSLDEAVELINAAIAEGDASKARRLEVLVSALGSDEPNWLKEQWQEWQQEQGGGA